MLLHPLKIFIHVLKFFLYLHIITSWSTKDVSVTQNLLELLSYARKDIYFILVIAKSSYNSIKMSLSDQSPVGVVP